MLYPVTLSGTDCLLLTARPDWSASVAGEFTARTASDAGLSSRQHRRRLARETVLRLSWSAWLDGPDHAAMRAALHAYANEPLLVPFWPGETALEDLAASPWGGGLRVFYEPDWASWEVAPSTQAEPFGFAASAECRVAPLLWTRWDKLPAPPEAVTARGAMYTFTVVENGAADTALRAEATLANGPSLGSLTPRLLDLFPDWGGAVASGGVDLRIARDRVGYGRAEVEYFVPHTPARRVKASFTPIGEETARLVALFQDRGGSAGPVWTPGQWHATTLALAASSGSSLITVDEAAALADEAALWLSDGTAFAARRITARAGNVLTLNATPGVFPAGTPVVPLWLCRFAGDTLRVQWTTPAVAAASLELVELPAETEAPAGETPGSTLGDLGTAWWGYLVSDGVATWRFTSHDAAIDAGALGLFEPRPIDHGDIVSELNLARHDVTLTAGAWDGSPFERWRTDRTAPRLSVKIYEGKTTAASSAKLIYTGTARTATYTGATARVPVRGPASAFDLKGPVAVVSQRCWAPFGGGMCGVDVNALSTEADLAEAGADGRLHFVASGTSSWPVRPRDYYRHGYLERAQADGTLRRVRIAASEPVRDDSLPPLGTLDPATAAWQAEVLANGGTLGDDTLAYCNHFATSLRACAAWSKIIYLNPFLGTNLAAACTPLLNRLGWPRPTTQNLDDGDVGDALGLRALSGPWRVMQISIPSGSRPSNAGLGAWVIEGDYTAFGNGSTVYLSPRAQYLFQNNANKVNGTLPAGWSHLSHWFGQGDLTGSYTSLYRNGQILASAPHTTDYDSGQYLNPYYVAGAGTVGVPWRLGISYMTSGGLSAIEAAELHDVIEATLMVPTGRIGSIDLRLVLTPATRVATLPTVFPAAGWRVVPGCDKSFSSCERYANRHRFRGFPHLPKTNPALVPVRQDTSSASKK
jgi:hypothetical protein